ncbi:hypothetical protein OUZ56_028329 [Daphnia magna]|uniref:Transmembrane protein n=1 Tax=Daphnia magna TaxID=35525 RepID=A0ABR0B3M6_9CRUS|nr:hypothetical protein OUZ56_028329 [Daphnia magna]
MCCHFALYRQLLRICRPLETHGQKAFRVAHPPTLLAADSATAKGHRMAFSRADGHPFSSLSLSFLLPPPRTSFSTHSLFFPPVLLSCFFFFFFLLWCARERVEGNSIEDIVKDIKLVVQLFFFFYFLMRLFILSCAIHLPIHTD